MTIFVYCFAANLCGWLIVSAFLAFFPRKPSTISFCAFCGAAARCSNDIVEHIKVCEKHPLRIEIERLMRIHAPAQQESDKSAKCGLCGELMPPGEEMFKYHGYSGSCPKPPLAQQEHKP